MKIRAHNPDTAELEKTYISSTADAGATSIDVDNTDGFSQNDKVLIGMMGQERSEIATVNALVSSVDTLPVSATDFPHDPDDPIYKLKWDQIKFYRSTTGKDGTYTELTTKDIDVDNEDNVTTHEDGGASSSYYYKVSYYDSVNALESDLSDPIAATGFEVNTAGEVIDRVMRQVGDKMGLVLREEDYLDLMNSVNKTLLTRTRKPYRFLKTSTTISTVADQEYVDLPSDLWKYNYAEYEDSIGSGTETYLLTPISTKRWRKKNRSSTTPHDDRLREVAIDAEDWRLYLNPTPKTSQSDVIILHYYKEFDTLNSIGDEIEMPNDLIYEYYLKSEFYYVKAQTDSKFLNLAQKFEDKFESEILRLPRINRIDVGSPKSFKPIV